MSTCRILSIDGGGIRGILTCVILERLELARPGFLASVDLFAGTSTGAILALGLAAGGATAEGRLIYEAMGRQIFARPLLRTVRFLGNALGAKYSNRCLRQQLADWFGDWKLGELPKKVLVPSFCLDSNPSSPDQVRTWKPRFFSNLHASDLKEPAVDVAMRSCATPTLFPSYQGYVDGGVVANNPSVAAIALALAPDIGGRALGEIVLLSLGTGRVSRFLGQSEVNWGWLRWGRLMAPLMIEGSADTAHYQCCQLLGDRYHRLDPVLPRAIAVGDTRRIQELVDTASEVDLAPTIEWLERHF